MAPIAQPISAPFQMVSRTSHCAHIRLAEGGFRNGLSPVAVDFRTVRDRPVSAPNLAVVLASIQYRSLTVPPGFMSVRRSSKDVAGFGARATEDRPERHCHQGASINRGKSMTSSSNLLPVMRNAGNRLTPWSASRKTAPGRRALPKSRIRALKHLFHVSPAGVAVVPPMPQENCSAARHRTQSATVGDDAARNGFGASSDVSSAHGELSPAAAGGIRLPLIARSSLANSRITFVADGVAARR